MRRYCFRAWQLTGSNKCVKLRTNKLYVKLNYTRIRGFYELICIKEQKLCPGDSRQAGIRLRNIPAELCAFTICAWKDGFPCAFFHSNCCVYYSVITSYSIHYTKLYDLIRYDRLISTIPKKLTLPQLKDRSSADERMPWIKAIETKAIPVHLWYFLNTLLALKRKVSFFTIFFWTSILSTQITTTTKSSTTLSQAVIKLNKFLIIICTFHSYLIII